MFCCLAFIQQGIAVADLFDDDDTPNPRLLTKFGCTLVEFYRQEQVKGLTISGCIIPSVWMRACGKAGSSQKLLEYRPPSIENQQGWKPFWDSTLPSLLRHFVYQSLWYKLKVGRVAMLDE
uniref:Uncharacterized protein n=1 Tax=Eutreptiella gymnastica TaxID=73025 RepID=A0A7S4FNF9_9EUGL|mmetsp:Transcript_26856/g.42580  ORF Transcript_26856/g.42580 Transcript_26856/m.42580 type:complete len:121 (+) Transcript_26856:272-634(+)